MLDLLEEPKKQETTSSKSGEDAKIRKRQVAAKLYVNATLSAEDRRHTRGCVTVFDIIKKLKLLHHKQLNVYDLNKELQSIK